MSYSAFALYYDRLTQNVNYPQRAEYFCNLMGKFQHDAGLTLDLACGTGSLTLELAKRGVDVYGVDSSPAMLSVAQQKAADADMQLLFLCQKMQKLDLYGTVDTVICALDSINHITNQKDVQKTFERVSLFLNPGGYFIFDMNTPYKHKYILGNHTFVYDMDDVYCVWQNSYESKYDRVAINLDFFCREGNVYYKSSEYFFELAYETDCILSMLSKAGLKTVGFFDELTFKKPNDKTERIVFVATKETNKGIL